MMRFHEWRSVAFQDASGKLAIIRGAPLGRLHEFSQLLTLIREQVDKANQDQSFGELYLNNQVVRQLVDKALELNGVNPSSLTLAMLPEFFFAYERDGQVRPGLLDELNLPQTTSKEGTATLEEYVASLAVALVGSGLEPSLTSALEFLQRTPPDEVQSYIDARTEQLDPKGAKLRKKNPLLEELESISPEADPTLNFSGFTGPR